MKIYSIRNNKFGQLALKGNVVHFAQDVNEINEQLPLNIKESPNIIVTESLDNINKTNQFIIRPDLIQNALNWLIKNNILYKNVKINNLNFSNLDINSIVIDSNNILNKSSDKINSSLDSNLNESKNSDQSTINLTSSTSSTSSPNTSINSNDNILHQNLDTYIRINDNFSIVNVNFIKAIRFLDFMLVTNVLQYARMQLCILQF